MIFSTSNKMDEIAIWNPEWGWVWGSLFGILDIWWDNVSHEIIS